MLADGEQLINAIEKGFRQRIQRPRSRAHDSHAVIQVHLSAVQPANREGDIWT